MPTVPLWAAFGAGMLSLFSPCVLPLLPAYIGFLSGTGARPEGEEGEEGAARSRSRVLGAALMFVLGFSLVFVLFGASASVIGQLLLRYQLWLQRIAGVLVIVFGLQTIGVLRIPFLERTFQWQVGRQQGGRRTLLQALVVGMAFGAGWAPCIGPILGSILLLAAASQTLLYGVVLLSVYALGMGLPFLLFALFLERLEGVLRFMRTRYRQVQIASGALLLVIGVMLYTNTFARLAQYGTFYYRFFEVW